MVVLNVADERKMKEEKWLMPHIRPGDWGLPDASGRFLYMEIYGELRYNFHDFYTILDFWGFFAPLSRHT